MMKLAHQQQYNNVKQALELIAEQVNTPLTLTKLAHQVGMSPYHFQRIFSDWAGISPKGFQQFLLKNQAQTALLQSSVQASSDELGLSSASRLHDLMIATQGITPGEYKQQGKNIEITYGWGGSPFGCCFLAQTQRGVCKLAFFDEEYEKQSLINELRTQWKLASIHIDQAKVKENIIRIFNACNDKSNTKPVSLHLMLKGTPFQMHVWEALLKIPKGKLLSYGQLATLAQKPNAVRAVSTAVANNPIAYLIPCHRVIRKTGAINQYRWSATRKQAMLLKECVLNSR